MQDTMSGLDRMARNGITSDTIDAAKRAADSVRLHVQAAGSDLASLAGRWIAVRLSDGRGGDTIYESRADAIADQVHEQQCCYIAMQSFSRQGYGPRLEMDLAIWIQYTKDAYARGFRIPDPDAVRADRGMQLLMTSRIMDGYTGHRRGGAR